MRNFLPTRYTFHLLKFAGAFCLLSVSGLANAQTYFWKFTNDYSGKEACGGELELSICFNGNESFIGIGTISFDPAEFVVTDPGDFTPGPSGTLTANVDAPFDWPFCLSLKGKRVNPADQVSFQAELNGLIGSTPYNVALLTTTPVFTSINGGSGTPISSFYLPSGNSLLTPQSSAITDQYVRISGHIIIDQDYYFGPQSEIVMDPGASITISPNVSFGLRFGTLMTACSTPWQHIEVLPGATLDLNTYLGSFSLITPCKIEGAEEAVRIQPGGKVNSYSTEYTDNGTAINALGNNGSTSTTQLKVVGCEFINNHKYFQNSTGIAATDLPYTVLPFYLNFVSVLSNHFAGLTTGVFSNNSDILIDRAYFEDVSTSVASFNGSDIELVGSGYYTIERGDVAVYSSESDLEVHDVHGEHLYNGIDQYPLFLNVTDIHDNNLSASINCINIGGGTNSSGTIRHNLLFNTGGKGGFPGTAALSLNDYNNSGSTGDWHISENRIESEGDYGAVYAVNFENARIFNNPSIIHTGDHPAVRIDGGNHNKVLCNGLLQGETGVFFNNTAHSKIDCNTIAGNKGIQVLGNCAYGKIRGNELYGDFADLLYGAPGSTYAYTGQQAYHRNKFLGNRGSGYNAINYEPAPDIAAASRYVVTTSAVTLSCPADVSLMPLFSSTYGSWFSNTAPPSGYCPFYCTNPCSDVDEGPFGGGEGGGGFNRVAGEIAPPTGKYSDGIRWTAQKRYNRLLMEPGNASPEARAASDENEWESIGQFQAFEDHLNRIMQWSEDEQNKVTALRAQRAEKTDLMKALPVVEKQGDQHTLKLAEYDRLLEEVQTISLEIDALKKQKMQQVEASLPALYALNDAIPATEIYEANQKTVNRLMLDRMTGHQYVWSEPEQNELLAIASQCPLSGGDAVFTARALLGEKAGFPVWDDIKACPDGTENLVFGAGNPDDTGISVFPNPAMDWVNVYVSKPGSVNQVVSIDLLGLEGRVFRSYRFEDGQSLMHLSLPALPAGIYMLRIVRSGETPDVFKLDISQH